MRLKIYRKTEEESENRKLMSKLDGITHLTNNQYFGDMELYDEFSKKETRSSEA